MQIPGFTAEASLYKPGRYYRNTAETANVTQDGSMVAPQLFGIGFCMADCDPDDWLCLFDCLGGLP